jgi:single stranded DNA-binding protein
MNTVTLVGHLQDDPARRDTAGGVVTTFRLAVQDRRHRLWIDVEAWGQLAGLATRLTKGRQVGVTGKLRNKAYTATSGERRDHWYIAANDLSFLETTPDATAIVEPASSIARS